MRIILFYQGRVRGNIFPRFYCVKIKFFFLIVDVQPCQCVQFLALCTHNFLQIFKVNVWVNGANFYVFWRTNKLHAVAPLLYNLGDEVHKIKSVRIIANNHQHLIFLQL